MLQLEKTINKLYTVKFDGKYLHSRYNPLKESETFIKKYHNLICNSYIVVYGLGLGYHIEQILENNCYAKIYVFEGNEGLLNLCKKINSKLFHINNVKIISYKNKEFYKKFYESIEKVSDIIIHRPSLDTIKETNTELYNLINNYNISKNAVDTTGLLKDNYLENLKGNYDGIKMLIERFKPLHNPCIITAAGPSLDMELPILKKNREKFTVISVGTSLRALTNQGIKPDIVVIIDGRKDVAKQLEFFQDENVPLCFLSTASRWAVKEYRGPKYIFFNSLEEDEFTIETGKTVAVAALNIALRCNAKEIVFLGQDLAYLKGRSHTNTFKDIYGKSDNPIINKFNKKVKGINGEDLETTKGYIYFKNQIENTIKNYDDVVFYNCSKGAFIEGAIHKSLNQYIDSIK